MITPHFGILHFVAINRTPCQAYRLLCSTYKKYYYRSTDGCTIHRISRKILLEIIPRAIQAVTTEIKIDKDKFIENAIKHSTKDISKEIANEETEVKLNELKSRTVNVKQFIEIADKYSEITELNQKIVNAFIDKVVVHKRSEPHKRKGYTQEVDVYFTFIGKI